MVPISPEAPETTTCRVISEIYRPGVRIESLRLLPEPTIANSAWSIKDAEKLYNMRGWGLGYFRTNADGNVTVHPDQAGDRAIDLYRLALDLNAQGIGLPLLIRFSDILKARIESLATEFRRAREETAYEGAYTGVFA